MQLPQSFLWHDYETWGTDPFADRPAQFAALRTDAALEPRGDPINWFCAPADDVLPHPQACLVTGITPQKARQHGISEVEFARRVHEEMMEPGTCIAGYNNLRFDDAFSRNLFYRNFYDPYEHEYSNGNSRWDLIDLVRMCYALRPDGIQWPMHEHGSPSFRLEDLTHANDILHAGAHDALSDVRATIELARLVRARQPRLFGWALGMREQAKVAQLLDPVSPEPVLHTTARIAAARGCTSLVLPLAAHPLYRKSVLVFDLMSNPTPLLTETPDRLHDLVFTPAGDLPEELERLPLKEIKTNGVPMVAPAATLRGVDCARIELDPDRCLEHARMILTDLPSVRSKVMEVYSQPPAHPCADPDLQIYSGGFFSGQDKRQMTRLRSTPPEQLGTTDWRFQDPRLPEMLFRYRARNFPETLDAAEAGRWAEWRMHRLLQPADSRMLGYPEFLEELARARADQAEHGPAQVILDQLLAWAQELGLPREPEAPG
jgi:exodeoxyribonuclease-1